MKAYALQMALKYKILTETINEIFNTPNPSQSVAVKKIKGKKAR